jgi:hypothetical protein
LDGLVRPLIGEANAAESHCLLPRIWYAQAGSSLIRIEEALMVARRVFAVAGSMFALWGCAAHAQTIQPPFNANYTFTALGSIPGVPAPYGGLTLLPDDPNILLIGGMANSASASIYRVQLQRDACGQIVGFVGTATIYASCPNIDGGLAFGPSGVLFATRFSNNGIHQFLPGATSPSRTIDFTPLGMASSTGSCNFVPPGFGGAGRFKSVSYNTGQFYDVTLTPDGNGTFNCVNPVQTADFPTTIEGFAYVAAGSPNFPVASMVVSEYTAGVVAAYEIDGQGNPIVSTRRPLLTGFGGPEGAFIDPGTGDFLFSTFTGNQLVIIRGFEAAADCDSIDFNNDGSLFDPVDIDAFLSVFSEGPCIPETATCNDIDFDNNGSCFDPNDIDSFLSVFSEGPCL